MEKLTDEEWYEKYKPIPNPFRDGEEVIFETYGEELQFVRNVPPLHVWTEVDTDEGIVRCSGYHLVNRFLYLVTEIPFEEGENIEINLEELFSD